MKRLLLSMLMLATAATSLFAQENIWQPTGVWPFVNQRFMTATVLAGFVKPSKTVVPANIHIGNQTLWYSQNDTTMEATRGSILRVEFSNGDVYVPVGLQYMGKVVKEDTIDGKLGRVIKVVLPDQKRIDDTAQNLINQTTMLQGASMGGLTSLIAGMADANGGIKQEEQPIPLEKVFYFLYNNEIFEATNKNILKRLPKHRRNEYRNFTRSAEIISTNESSMVKVWDEFFLKTK